MTSPIGGSTIWVMSTVLWQRRVEDSFRGRVHALDFLVMTGSFVVWGLIAGLLYDRTGSLGTAFAVPALAAIVAGPLWWILGGRRLAQTASSARPSASKAR